jgi:hypothetical protein
VNDPDALLKMISRRGRLLLGLDMSWISFYDESTGDSYVHSADGTVTALTIGFRVPGNAGAGSRARGSNAPFWTADYLADDQFPHSPVIDDVVRAEGLHAIIAVPLLLRDAQVGTLYASDRNIRHFSADEISLMCSLADLAVVAIDRARAQDSTAAEVRRLSESDSAVRQSLGVLRDLAATDTRIIDAVLAGVDLPTLADTVSVALSGPVRICSPDNRLLTSAGEQPPSPTDDDRLMQASLEAYTSQRPVQLDDGGWVTAVRAGGESLGFLVAHPRTPLTNDGMLLLQWTVQATAVQLLLSRSTAVVEHQLRDDLLDDLLSVPPRHPQRLRERALRLGVDLNDPHVVVVASPAGGSHSQAVMWAATHAARLGGMKSTRGGALVLLLPGTDAGAQARAVSKELSRVIRHPVTTGAGASVGLGPEGIGHAHREAVRCLDTLIALGRTGATACAADLGFLGILLSVDRDVEAYVHSVIGPVIDYDTRRFTELVATLAAYFESGASPTRAAESLHVHPNTVSRRLERITDLLGTDWQTPSQALEVQLALRLHQARKTLAVLPDQAGTADA